MKVVFFSHYFPPEGNAPASRTYEHCRRWVERGADVTVITCAPNVPNGVVYSGYANTFPWCREEVDGIKVVRVWTVVAANAGSFKRIVNFLSYLVMSLLATLFVSRPNVIVATSPQFFCGWAGVLASFRWWRPLVLEIRDIWPESIQVVGAMKNGLVLRVLEMLERWMYASANWIVAVGDGYRENVRKKCPSGKRISVITNGADLSLFEPESPDRSEYLGEGLADKFVCSYVGTIGLAHGLEVVVSAAEKLRNAQRDDIVFCLVGDGARREELCEEVRARGLDHIVRFIPLQPKKRIPGVLAASDACFVHLKACSLFTTVIPSKIFEAMAMARPIVMGVAGQANDIVLDAKAGVEMEPGCPDSLVRAVQLLADNPDLTADLGRHARDAVASQYNRDTLAIRYLDVLARAAGLMEWRQDRVVPTPSRSTPDEARTTQPVSA